MDATQLPRTEPTLGLATTQTSNLMEEPAEDRLRELSAKKTAPRKANYREHIS